MSFRLRRAGVEKEMITVFFQGGLGNQMFQYAAGRAVADKLGTGLRFDTSWYHYPVKRKFLMKTFGVTGDVVKSPVSFISNLVLKKPLFDLLGTVPVYRETSYVFDPDIFNVTDSTALIGSFQSEKYFRSIADKIRKEYSFFHLPVDSRFEEWHRKITGTNSVAVHVRRGDYLKYPKFNVCTEQYYRRAIEYVKSKSASASFYFFSDDLDWCRETFQGKEFSFCDSGASVGNPIQDLRLMSACHHHVLTNSSFSWWGAWLGYSGDQVVVAPETWFACEQNTDDIPCEEWIRLPC